ncbi:hypothetical protein Tco_0492348 [Tanacetum coccineum]
MLNVCSTPKIWKRPLVQDEMLLMFLQRTSHLLAVKRIFRYLKGKPSLGLWYSKDSPLELVAYTDSDYAGATQDRKSTTGGCQFLGNRLISWQCKKKRKCSCTSTTEAEYVAACKLLTCGQKILFNILTKHIEIRHHFIRDCNAKKLIQMAKIDTEHNVADLLTKGFDAGRFQYLVSILLLKKSSKGQEIKGLDVKIGKSKEGKELKVVLSELLKMILHKLGEEISRCRGSENENKRAPDCMDEVIARLWMRGRQELLSASPSLLRMIDWNGNYKISDFKGMSYNEIRPIFEKVWDFNQHIEPMDMEHGSEKMKSPEKIEEEDVDTQKEMKKFVKEIWS